MPDIPSKFQKVPSITFRVILYTHTQTNKNRQKHYLLGGGKNWLHFAYPRWKVSGRAEVAAEHGQTERAKEQDDRQKEDIRHVDAVASVALEHPATFSAGVRQHTCCADEHFVAGRVTVVIQSAPVPSERGRLVGSGFQIAS